MNKSSKWTLFALSLLLANQVTAQEAILTLSLDSCRTLALTNNKELRIANSNWKSAYYEHKAATTKYLPRISATGTYLHSSKEISLLNHKQKETLNNLGTNVSSIAPSMHDMSGILDNVGASLVDALHTDTRNATALGIMLTQPLYMGGKIAAYNKITRFAKQIAENQQDLAIEDVIVTVDEAYWQIISLCSKKLLAESYLSLVQTLDKDIEKMINEGFATKADGLSVKVKVNEAKVALIQINNGLSMSRMRLCQICGLNLNSAVTLADEKKRLESSDPQPVSAEAEEALSLRKELNILSLSSDIYKEKIKLARSAYLPNIALTGGYMASNPSVFNGFEQKMKGIWNVGVTVSMPIITFGERNYKIKAAKADALTAFYKLEDTRDKVELQVNQNLKKVQEATERLNTAHRSCDEADENLRYATLGMQEGVIPVSNVLEAQTAWLKSHSEHVSAQIDLRLANLYLLKSVGTLSIK